MSDAPSDIATCEPGDRIRLPAKPYWGIGEVLRSGDPGLVEGFFIGRGRVKLSLAHARLELVIGLDAVHPALDVLSTADWDRATYSIYVVRLRDQVMLKGKYAESNPDRNPALPCVYVGMTGIDPEDRLEQHKTGYKSSKYTRRFVIDLERPLFAGFNKNLPRVVAEVMEPAFAVHLRSLGYGVWQH